MLLSYSQARRVGGITVTELLKDHPEELRSDISVIAAVDLLAEEGKVMRETSTDHPHSYDSLRIFPLTLKEEL
jgi:hypothetical protein